MKFCGKEMMCGRVKFDRKNSGCFKKIPLLIPWELDLPRPSFSLFLVRSSRFSSTTFCWTLMSTSQNRITWRRPDLLVMGTRSEQSSLSLFSSRPHSLNLSLSFSLFFLFPSLYSLSVDQAFLFFHIY